ncbi:MAG: YfhO family protein [Chloroflexi bacterium]|nr:YfhO family protein [Chloroflexota bacterium]
MKLPIYERRWFAPLVLLALTIVVFRDVLFATSGHGLVGSDFRQLHYPLLQFVVRTVHDTGAIPLWNPHQFLGYSVVGNPQYGLFYPPNWLLILFQGDALMRGVGLLIALHIFWLALGTNLLLRLYGAHPIAALGAGIAVAFGGFPSARIYAGHYAVLLTMAWIPMVMAGLRLALLKRRPVWAIPGGVALALAVLGGHPQMAYIMGVGLGIQWLHECSQLGRPMTPGKLAVPLRQLLLMGILGGLLSAVTWLPAWDYSHKTQRGGEADSLAFANQHAVPLAQLFGLVVPDWFGEPNGDPIYWGKPFYEEMTAYVGILPLLCLALLWRTRRREIWFFAALTLLGLILSLGKDGILYRVLYELLPPARDFRAPGRFLFLASIGLAGIMAITLTEICQSDLVERRRRLRPLTHYLIPVSVVGLWFGGMVLALKKYPNDLTDQQAEYRAIQMVATISFLILIGSIVWAWRRDWRHASAVGLLLLMIFNTLDVWRVAQPLIETDSVRLSPIWQAAERLVPSGTDAAYGRVMQMSPPPGIPNGASWIGYQSPQGYDPIAPLEWTRLTERTGQYILDPGSATNRILGVRYILSGTAIENYGFGSTAYFENIGQSGDFWFYENPFALPRAYLVERYAMESNPAAVLDRIMNGEVDRGDVVLLDQDPHCEISGQGGTATIVKYTPNRVTIEVISNGPGLLVLTDQYDDDWQVWMDGQSADLLRANDLTRAVCVPAGHHTVEFSYRPIALSWGACLFGVGSLLLLILAGGAFWSGRHGQTKVAEIL